MKWYQGIGSSPGCQEATRAAFSEKGTGGVFAIDNCMRYNDIKQCLESIISDWDRISECILPDLPMNYGYSRILGKLQQGIGPDAMVKEHCTALEWRMK